MGEVPRIDIKEGIMGKLVQGKTMANQLQALLLDPVNGRSDLAHELLAKILGSFTESLSVLGSPHPPEGVGEKRSVDSKDKRGCYKRRKSCQSRTTVASTIEDDHSWRKYGQKEILHSKYPRSYFRCTHKYDQNCKAIRQVQKMEENPRMYEITYIGVHTCMDGRKAPPPPPPPPPHPQTNKDFNSLCDIQSFDVISGSNSLDIKDDLPFDCSSTGAPLAVKEEAKEDAKSELTDIEIDSLLMGAGDLPEGSSKYQGYGMDFLMDDESSNLSMFGY